jgi:hypothetical protein
VGYFQVMFDLSWWEKQMTRNKRQHIVAMALIMACGILVWQCWSLWGGHSEPAKTPVVVAKSMVVTPPTKPNTQHASLPVIQSPSVPELTAVQQRYLELADQVRLAHLERALAEEQAGTLQAMSNQTGRYQQNAVRHTAPTKAGTSLRAVVQEPAAVKLTVPVVSAPRCALQYVDQQQGQWSATVQCGPESFDVQAGQSLSGGYLIEAVDAHGVVMSQKHQRWRLSLYGVRPMPASLSASALTTPQHNHQQALVKPAKLSKQLAQQTTAPVKKIPGKTPTKVRLSSKKLPARPAVPSKVAAKPSQPQRAVSKQPPTHVTASLLDDMQQQAARGGRYALSGSASGKGFDGKAVREVFQTSSARLRHADPSVFLVQLFASTDMSAAWQKYLFLQKHQRHNVFLVRSRQGQQVWYKVMVGFDQTYAEALRRAQNLERVHAAFKGWVRPVQRTVTELA